MSHDWRVSLSAFQCLNFKSGNWKEGYFLTTNSTIYFFSRQSANYPSISSKLYSNLLLKNSIFLRLVLLACRHESRNNVSSEKRCSIRFHDSVTNVLRLKALWPYYRDSHENFKNPSRSGNEGKKKTSFNGFLATKTNIFLSLFNDPFVQNSVKKKNERKHVRTILVENWILFIFYEIFDFREMSRSFVNPIENSKILGN